MGLEPKPPVIIDFWGLKLPIPRWTVAVLGVLASVGVGLFLYQKVMPHDDRELLTLRQANTKLVAEMEEYGQHLMDAPAFETATMNGDLGLKIYEDGCVAIKRKTARAVLTHLVIDLARAAQRQSTMVAADAIPVAHDTTTSEQRCLNPHPGQFRWWHGQHRDPCWVEVWRQWPDGCQHMQLFNACASLWDSNHDGSARVRWTHCNH